MVEWIRFELGVVRLKDRIAVCSSRRVIALLVFLEKALTSIFLCPVAALFVKMHCASTKPETILNLFVRDYCT